MNRKDICEIPETFTSKSKIINKVFDFELITPMFGGDAESWKIDCKNPIRSQSVKGMLRFWWRTMQSIADEKQLLYKENSIWGGKTGDNSEKGNRCQSSVKLSVINQKSEYDIFKPNERNNKFAGVCDDSIPAYVLFPIVDKVKEGEEINYIKTLNFQIQISYPENVEGDVLNSLKLWCLFGGVGARTRRGTGSLYCEQLLAEFTNKKDLKEFIDSFGKDSTELIYPRISGANIAVASETNADTTGLWHGMLTRYGEYRQGRDIGRGHGQGNHPGRSFWPEPDSIREITGAHAATHQPNHPDRNWFPRSSFGLPILTEFRSSAGDPRGKIMLEPNIGTGERWPSPVIMKVIKLPSGAIYKVVFVLNQKIPSSLQLKAERKTHTLTDDEMPTNIRDKVMKTNDELNGRTIYQHLIDFLNLEVVE